MELKDILNHRNKCIFCQSPLDYYCTGYPNLSYHVNDEYFKISSPFKNSGVLAAFYFDGRFSKPRKSYKIYKTPIEITKGCGSCLAKSESSEDSKLFRDAQNRLVQTKSRTWSSFSVGDILTNVKRMEYSYTFTLNCSTDTYTVSMGNETVRYFDDNAFWHLDILAGQGTSLLHHGSWSSNLNQLLKLQVPSPINLDSIQNPEQFVKKIKTYIMMS